EDGIRDRNVTGVQTCALPISGRAGDPGERLPPLSAARCTGGGGGRRVGCVHELAGTDLYRLRRLSGAVPGCRLQKGTRDADPLEIGRASCRERDTDG